MDGRRPPRIAIKTVAEDATLEHVQSLLRDSPLAAVVTTASFATRCQTLLQELKKSGIEAKKAAADSNGCCGGEKPPDYDIFVVATDGSDELEEVAINLGLNDVPSFQIYKNGTLVVSSGENVDVTAQAILQALHDSVSNGNTSCCPPGSSGTATTGRCCPETVSQQPRQAPVACCPEGSSSTQAPVDASEVLRLVAASYANTVVSHSNNNNNNGDGGCCVSANAATLNGYNADQLLQAGAEIADLGLGCGTLQTLCTHSIIF